MEYLVRNLTSSNFLVPLKTFHTQIHLFLNSFFFVFEDIFLPKKIVGKEPTLLCSTSFMNVCSTVNLYILLQKGLLVGILESLGFSLYIRLNIFSSHFRWQKYTKHSWVRKTLTLQLLLFKLLLTSYFMTVPTILQRKASLRPRSCVIFNNYYTV